MQLFLSGGGIQLMDWFGMKLSLLLPVSETNKNNLPVTRRWWKLQYMFIPFCMSGRSARTSAMRYKHALSSSLLKNNALLFSTWHKESISTNTGLELHRLIHVLIVQISLINLLMLFSGNFINSPQLQHFKQACSRMQEILRSNRNVSF